MIISNNGNTAATQFTIASDQTAPTNQDTVFSSLTSKQGGGTLTIVSSGTASNNVWLAPSVTTSFAAGATMTTAGGTATSILAPATEGDYKLFVIDAAGNYSTASSATLTVDNTAPTNQDTVFSASASKQGGITVIIVSSGDATNNVWFALSGTTSFAAGATMTTAGSTATSILAPATAGTYKLFVIDAVGNYSTASLATLTVDNTAPTNQDDVFPTSTTKTGGGTVTIVSSGDATNNVWLAPSGTTSFAAGATMTTVGGTATSILAPATAGSYKLFVIDLAGNYSSASTATLTVDNTAPTITITSDQTSPTNVTTINMTVTFSEDVTGFAIGDITVANGTKGNFNATSATIYTFDITSPTNGTTVTVNINSSVATDTAGNGNTAATQFSIASDQTRPAVTITTTQSSPTNATTINATATFTKAVTGFSIGDITVANGTKGNFSATSTTVYTFDITSPTDGATVTIDIAQGVATDGTGNTNTAADQFTIASDQTAPTNQDTVFSASTSKQGGATLTIVSSGDATNNVWLAPSGTTSFAAGATKTTAGGTATSIASPATAGTYKLFIIDAAGNYSTASSATLRLFAICSG